MAAMRMDDPQVQKKQRVLANASFKAFNSVATTFLKELCRLYPTDSTIRLLMKEMEKVSEDRSKISVPATLFFKELRKPAKRFMDNSTCTYADLLAEHAVEAFKDPIPVMILQGIGLSTKWAEMSPDMRVAIWAYVDRLLHLSAQAVFSNNAASSQMNDLTHAVVTAVAKNPSAAQNPQEIMHDPEVQRAADHVVNSMK